MANQSRRVVRIAGRTLGNTEQVWHSLRRIKGIGTSRARKICAHFDISDTDKVESRTDDQIKDITSYIEDNFIIEGELTRQVRNAINMEKTIKSYRGRRHQDRLPLRQRTKTNAKTARKATHLRDKEDR